MAEFDSKLSAVRFLENINKVDSEGKPGVNKSKNKIIIIQQSGHQTSSL